MENNNLKPLAVVNSKAIYESDIDEMLAQMGQRGAAYQSAQGRAMILEQLIAQRLCLASKTRQTNIREDIHLGDTIGNGLAEIVVAQAGAAMEPGDEKLIKAMQKEYASNPDDLHKFNNSLQFQPETK